MKKLISMVLITMILCSLLSVPALAEDAQGQAAGSAETATMSVTGGTINPDGTVSWAVGENILTITMPDGSTYTITVTERDGHRRHRDGSGRCNGHHQR